MCAIFGIVGEYETKRAIEAFRLLAHRGPDAETLICDESLFAASARLSITDVAESSLRCRYGEDIVLFNGEIYNYKELAEEFGSSEMSETDVIYEAFRRWDREFISHLRGMFAIAIVTPERVLLARDLFGKKPLYYARFGERLIFSSEVRAIVHLYPEIGFERRVLSHLLFFQTTIAPMSFYPAIRQLSPSEVVEIGRGAKESSTFPYSPFSGAGMIKKRQEAVEEIERRVLEAVAIRIPKEVKWGALLSGGLDSSTIAAMAAGIRGESIDTFCIGYEGYEKYDERRYAAMAAQHISSNHHEFTMDMEDFLIALDELCLHLDEPLLDPAAVPLWFMMKKISAGGFKVVLSGDGSDEIFLGYRLYREYHDISKASGLKYRNWLRNYFRANFSMNKEWERYKRVFDQSILFRSMSELFTDLQLNRILKLNVKDDSSLQSIEPLYRRFEAMGGTDETQWYSYCDINTLLAELFLKKLDRVSMAHSIEARSPFLDKRVVEYLLGVDSSLKLDAEGKGLLKSVARSYLPPEIVYRKKKGFSYPFMEWLSESGELERVRRVQEKTAIFREDALSDLLERGKRRSRFKQHIYAIYFLCRWLEKRYDI